MKTNEQWRMIYKSKENGTIEPTEWIISRWGQWLKVWWNIIEVVCNQIGIINNKQYNKKYSEIETII